MPQGTFSHPHNKNGRTAFAVGSFLYVRMGGDSNSRLSFPNAGFRNQCLQPLSHPSVFLSLFLRAFPAIRRTVYNYYCNLFFLYFAEKSHVLQGIFIHCSTVYHFCFLSPNLKVQWLVAGTHSLYNLTPNEACVRKNSAERNFFSRVFLVGTLSVWKSIK